jgi:uncharacterized protein with GYD domain
MAKYVSFFTYTSDAWARMTQHPGDRTATIRQVADSLGGFVECVYWMFGTTGWSSSMSPTRSVPPP